MDYTEYFFNLASQITTFIMAAGIGICVLCLFQIHRTRFTKSGKNFFRVFFSMVLAYLVAHLTREQFGVFPSSRPEVAVIFAKAFTLIEFLLTGGMAFIVTLLLIYATHLDRLKKTFYVCSIILISLNGIALIIGAFTDLFYHFDIVGQDTYTVVYSRSNLYILSNIPQVLLLLLDAYILLRHGKNLDKRLRIAFWIYIAAPIVAAIVQIFLYKIQFVALATVVATVYMFYAVLAIQAEEYEKQQKEASRLDMELSMATKIQSDMLPNIFPAFPDRKDFDIYATMDPAKEVGGDFYDFFLIDNDHLCMVMADVSGKGVPAALFMMASRIILANHAMLGKSPAQILTDSNASICLNNREELFVTVWLGILEISTGKLTASNAGHEYPFIKTPDGKFEKIKDKHGFVIGGFKDAKYKNYEIQLESGSKIFLYTDGVPEATDANKTQFGMDRMISALNISPNDPPKTILKTVRKKVDEFVNNAEQFDDITMLCLEYKGAGNTQNKN